MTARADGPHALLRHSPVLEGQFHALSRYFREESILSPDLRELAIVATARTWGSDYVWQKHRARAEALLPEGLLTALTEGHRADAVADRHAIVLDMCEELREHGGVSDRLWLRAAASLGLSPAVDLLAVIGLYRCVVALAGTPGPALDHVSADGSSTVSLCPRDAGSTR